MSTDEVCFGEKITKKCFLNTPSRGLVKEEYFVIIKG